MFALTVLLFTGAFSQTSALNVQSRKPVHSTKHRTGPVTVHSAKPLKKDKAGNIVDPGDRIFTRGSDEHDQLPSIYGPGKGPRILGLNHCKKFQDSFSPADRMWGAAGMPNTGTNALWSLMTDNCKFPNRSQFGGAWQVPWGKHEFLHRAQTHAIQKKVSHANTMVVALAKDPVQWMASTCRHSYFRVNGVARNERCPAPVNMTSGSYNDNDETKFDSLMDIWGSWYSEYFENDHLEKQPALVIRFEDLLFRPEPTIKQVCDCLGFESNAGHDFMILESIAKWGAGHGQPTNRSETIAHYSSKRSAVLERLSPDDGKVMSSSAVKTGADKVLDFFEYPIWAVGFSQALGSKALAREEKKMHAFVNNQKQQAELLATSDWGDDE